MSRAAGGANPGARSSRENRDDRHPGWSRHRQDDPRALAHRSAGHGRSIHSGVFARRLLSKCRRARQDRRGPPRKSLLPAATRDAGTHRTEALLDALQKLRRGDDVDLPRFDKSLHAGRGDIAGEVLVRGRQHLVLFEGWCAGIPPATAAEVIALSHRIAASDPALPSPPLDPELSVVLAHVPEYQPAWALIDYWIVLAPTPPPFTSSGASSRRRNSGRAPVRACRRPRFANSCGTSYRSPISVTSGSAPDPRIGIDDRHRYYRRS